MWGARMWCAGADRMSGLHFDRSNSANAAFREGLFWPYQFSWDRFDMCVAGIRAIISHPLETFSTADEAPINHPDYFRKTHCRGKVVSNGCLCDFLRYVYEMNYFLV